MECPESSKTREENGTRALGSHSSQVRVFAAWLPKEEGLAPEAEPTSAQPTQPTVILTGNVNINIPVVTAADDFENKCCRPTA
jgi:hypothetical protein